MSTKQMARLGFQVLLCLLLGLAASFGLLALKSGDPFYSVYEWVSPARFQQFDPLIESIAGEHQLDPMLIKAVVWRESRFDPRKIGTAGERGLMQVTERAATEWARENKIENFQVEDLFDPKTNIEAGSWYLGRAMQRWKIQSDPMPFALAEYNAGPSRAQRWAGGNESMAIPPKDFLQNIDFPATRKYVESIIERYRFYQDRGRM